jgi:hypothetical protein
VKGSLDWLCQVTNTRNLHPHRTRPLQINGKSANLNSCLKNVIYKDLAARPTDIPKEEVIVVFDADMRAKRSFFCKILEVMVDDDVALCLTPQAFSNVNSGVDIFNNTNQQVRGRRRGL